MNKLPTILVALVYNDNGMATWCYEAVRALKREGCVVWLAYRKPGKIPQDLVGNAIEYVAENENRHFFKKVYNRFQKYSELLFSVKANNTLIPHCLELLKKNNEIPTHIILNQSSYVCPQLPLQQWVVGWAWPTDFFGYIGKTGLKSNLPFFDRFQNFVYWYKMDKKGYKLSDGVLTVTKILEIDLLSKGLVAKCVYPGTSSLNRVLRKILNNSEIHFISAALNLEDKRKNIEWMLNTFIRLHQKGIKVNLTLIGEYSELFKDKLERSLPQVKLKGKLPRKSLIEEMALADVFVFASLQDDWGYVLVEAMANGLAVLAPDKIPFSEIVGKDDYLFNDKDPVDFERALIKIIENPSQTFEDRLWFYNRYKLNFSSEVFGKNLLKAINS